MLTIIGQLATSRGLVQQRDAVTNEAVPFDLPAVAYLRDQPARLPLLGEHDSEWLLGAVGALERSKQDGLMMVGRIVHDDFAELLENTGPWYLSAGVRARRVGTLRYGHGLLRSVSLVRHPGALNTRPVRWSRGDIATGSAGAPLGLPLNWHGTWARAAERMSSYAYKRAKRMDILDLDQLDLVDELLTNPSEARRSLLVRAEAELAAAEDRLARTTPPISDPNRVFRHSYPGAGVRLVGA